MLVVGDAQGMPKGCPRLPRQYRAHGTCCLTRRVSDHSHPVMSSQRSGPEQRKAHRVVFERGYPAHMMAIDGTWRRECTMEDVSEGGARLTVEGSIEGL